MYSDPIIKKIIAIIKAAQPDIKGYYQGDPIKIPDSMLPCCIVSKSLTRAGQMTNAEDGQEVGLTITIVTAIRAELSTEENISHIAPGVAKLYDIVEARDENYKLQSNSLLNILRTNQLLDVGNNLRIDLSTPTRIDYGQTLRQRQPEMWSVEARIDIVVNFIQIR